MSLRFGLPAPSAVASALPMLLYRSSDLDHLVDRLCHVLSEGGPGLLEPEVILIQSAGMERWLSREIAKRRGVAANLSFPFPRAFLHGVLEETLGPDAAATRYESSTLVWELFGLLGQVKGLAGYEIVARNIAGDADGSRQFQLARELADLFDQYLTYRPRMILDWEAGKESGDFQADLFRRLVNKLGPFHFAQRFRRFLKEVTDEQLKRSLPCRLSLIGGPGLPPAYLRILARIGEVIPVHIFSFQVCSEYFADLHPDGELLPELGAGAHPLLVSFGKVGADFQTLIEQQGAYVEADAHFPKRESQTLLAHLQNDIQSGNRREPEFALPATALRDQSITLDACHSPLREVEVLADRLLCWFAEDPSLRPEDVVVLSPDIEAYSPLISAVFGARGDSGPGLPFRISDRTEGAFNPAAKALLLGLELLSGRLKASAFLDFLQVDPVQARFGLSPIELERISDWVRKVGIRWGADDEHLRSYGINNAGIHTLTWGLRRLLLGYACADEGDALFDGVVPEDDVPSGDAELLGRFAELTERLIAFRAEALRGQRPPSEWTKFVLDFFTAFIGETPSAHWDPLVIRQVIVDFAQGVKDAEISEPLGLAPIVEALATQLEARRSGTDFLSGGITFCALLPLRTIPFRRICVLGLDQDRFPRADTPSSLSWIDRAPRPGDRSLRADDRFLFLELLLAARERLSLSYVGRSVQDNTDCPASVVVSELADVLGSMVADREQDGGSTIGRSSGRVLSPLVHPLQPFSPRYFAGKEGLRSFDRRAFDGARALVAQEDEQNRGISAFVDGRLEPWDSAEAIVLSIEELVRFYKNPARAFLAGLEVRIDDEIDQFEDREPTSSDPLTRFGLGDELVQRGLFGQPVFEEVQLARGLLPPGSAGRAVFSEVERYAREILADAQRVLQLDQLRGRRIEVALDCALHPERVVSVLLTGRLEICASYHARASYGVPDAKRQLAVWIEHLALCAVGEAVHSVLIGRASPSGAPSESSVQTFCFEPLAPTEAAAELATLVAGFLSGSESPLCFFPAASLAFADACAQAEKSGRVPASELEAYGITQAEKAFGRFGKEMFVSPEVEQAFRGQRLLGGLSNEERAAFVGWANRIFLPLLAHQRVISDWEGEA